MRIQCFSSFVKSFIATTPAFSKYFYLNKLSIVNDKYCISDEPVGKKIMLSNILILLEEDDIKLLFSYNNKLYSYGFEINKPKFEPAKKIDLSLVEKSKDPFINTLITGHCTIDKTLIKSNI